MSGNSFEGGEVLYAGGTDFKMVGLFKVYI